MTNPTPVAWCVAYDDPRCGRIHSNPSMSKAIAVNVRANAHGKLDLVELFTAAQLNQAKADALREAAAIFDQKHTQLKHCHNYHQCTARDLRAMAAEIEGEKK